jgi:hypothetical protein
MLVLQAIRTKPLDSVELVPTNGLVLTNPINSRRVGNSYL